VSRDLPNFVVIGAPRAGTTTLASYLSDHPDVFVAPGKEVRFFTHRWSRGLDWYRAQFAASGRQRRIGEASPQYMHDTVAMTRLTTVLPDADLIAVLRNPVDRANSHFHYRAARGLETRTLSEALHDELDGRQDVYPYLAMGAYHHQLTAIDDVAPHHRRLILWYDDLAEDLPGVLRSVASFLGISDSWDERAEIRVVNSADRFRSLRVRRWQSRVPRQLRSAIGHLNRVQATYPAPDPVLHELMLECLGSDIGRLQEYTGRELSAWLDRPPAPTAADTAR
jgi:hypothetical protein